MKKDFHNDVDKENLDIANKILSDSEQMSDKNISKPELEDVLRNKQISSKRRWMIGSAIAACLVLAIGLKFLPKNLSDNTPEHASDNVAAASDYSEIYDKLVSANKTLYASDIYAVSENATVGVAKSADRASAYFEQETTATDDDSFYNTNEQTANVHEGDIVKTDGKCIYTLQYSDKKNCHQLIITKADGMKMNIVKKIVFEPKDTMMTMKELYVCNNRLVVIGTQYDHAYYEAAFSRGKFASIYPFEGSSETCIYVYDISQPENATLIETLSQDGVYVSSRMKDNYLYTVTTHTMVHPTKEECVPKVNGELMASDSVYLPEQIEGNQFTVITGLDVTDAKAFTTSKSVLGGSSNIYVSQNHIYIINAIYDREDISDTNAGKKAFKKYQSKRYKNEKVALDEYDKEYVKQYIKENNLDIQFQDIEAYKDTGAYQSTTRTEIVKFTYDKGEVSFIADKKVEGHAEDNLSFDEKDDYLRCVTTESSDKTIETAIKCYDKDGKFLFDILKESEYIGNTEDTNNVFVLDKKLNIAAQINNLAKGERIYSARYLGDYGYFVTYEQTDPLFSVDFSDMEHPQIIGELKMPGYSEYLHFYGENKLFGFGVEEGTESNQLKLEMYDLKDGKAEKEAKKLLKNYSYSESLYNYKSIMVDPEKNLIGFAAEEAFASDWNQYYVVYSYNNNKFQELYKIKINQNAYAVRGFYIGNYLYVVAPEYGVYAINMETYSDDNKVKYIDLK